MAAEPDTLSMSVSESEGPVDWSSGAVPKSMLMLKTHCAVKSKLINKAIQDIGMGRYNWQLFVLCGFGWFADK